MIAQSLLTEEMKPAGDGLWYGSKVTDTFGTGGKFCPETETTINEFCTAKIQNTYVHLHHQNTY